MKLPVSVSRNVGKSVLAFKKQSPHIFFGVGVAGTITSTVLACRATLKLSEKLDEIKQRVNDVKTIEELTLKASPSADHAAIVNERRKDMAYVYIHGGVELTKLYAPAAIVGVASIACLTGSHIQLTKRNTALMAAYATLQKAYDEYRSRVREQLGDEKELELHRGVTTEVIKGEEVKSVDPNSRSPYSVFFDEYSPNWQKDPELNRLFITCQQNYANNLLRARGHIFLNEVYDMLGVERTKAGAVVGWVIGETGDNFVDFGIYEAYNSRFVNGMERSIILDFNVDGVIYDKI